VWTGGSFSLHQSLGLQDITTAVPFRRGSTNLQFLAVCRNRTSSVCLIYQWNNGRFQNPQTLAVNTRVKQVESFQMAGDTFLLIVTEGNNHTQSVVLLQFNSIFNLKMSLESVSNVQIVFIIPYEKIQAQHVKCLCGVLSKASSSRHSPSYFLASFQSTPLHLLLEYVSCQTI